MLKYHIRLMKPEEYPLLKTFTYHAIFQRAQPLLPFSVVEQPELNVYYEDFGKPHDCCLAAEYQGRLIGAVWTRIIEGFGHVDDDTPEFGISIYPEFRGKGVGTALMKAMLSELSKSGYPKTSLAVQKDNYALRMYQKTGFFITGETPEEYIMECVLSADPEIEIIRAANGHLDEMGQFYDTVNDYLAAGSNYPGWKKGIYPTKADAAKAIAKETLFVAVHQGRICGSIILNHEPESAYGEGKWLLDIADYREVFVIHTLAVHPDYLHMGIGKKLLDFSGRYAKARRIRSIRLDVCEQNLPAIRLYEKRGYLRTGRVNLGLEEFGLDWFWLYEKLIVPEN